MPLRPAVLTLVHIVVNLFALLFLCVFILFVFLFFTEEKPRRSGVLKMRSGPVEPT